MKSYLPFNKPFGTGKELFYIAQAVMDGHLSGDGPFSKRCEAWLEQYFAVEKAFLTPSCTAALELSALLLDIQPGDEVIIPSFTFVSTATAYVLQGAVPVFVDIRPDTLNLDESLVEAAITEKTRAIVVVHYGGCACDMTTLRAIADRHGLALIEDAAHAMGASYQGRPLGSFGDLSCLSFHETKNVQAGEGGALLINRPAWIERASILRQKGTNRTQFLSGQVDKYTWVDIGSSYVVSEIIAAFLWGQLEHIETLTQHRTSLWHMYREKLAEMQRKGYLALPSPPPGCRINGHIFYLLTRTQAERRALIEHLESDGINAVFHYIPLHSSPAGLRFGRTAGTMAITDSISSSLLRLPIYPTLEECDVDRVVESIVEFYEK